MKRFLLCLILLLSMPSAAARGQEPVVELKEGDVVAFVGGELIVQEGETGHLESLLAAAFADRSVRFRNFGWEADTVFEQPREENFPGVVEQLQRFGATVAFLQFGRQESLAGAGQRQAFIDAYERLCDEIAAQTPRLVLMTPPPFEKPSDPLLPDLSGRNADLKEYAAAIRQLAERRGYACIDLFEALITDAKRAALTADGVSLSQRGSALVAQAAARQLGFNALADRAGAPADDGAWDDEALESLRQAVITKNKLWFDYWRPMNWAFLAGERAYTQSSQDPNDPSIRFFPAEMEKFVPLIEEAERQIANLAQKAAANQ